MKLLIAALTALVGTSASADLKGSGMLIGDKILFQDHSAYVSAVYNNDSLCFDGTNYHAVIPVCLDRGPQYDESVNCVKWGKVAAIQPAVSTRQRCVSIHSTSCTKFETVPFIQEPTMLVKRLSQSGDGSEVVDSEVVTVRPCGSNVMN